MTFGAHTQPPAGDSPAGNPPAGNLPGGAPHPGNWPSGGPQAGNLPARNPNLPAGVPVGAGVPVEPGFPAGSAVPAANSALPEDPYARSKSQPVWLRALMGAILGAFAGILGVVTHGGMAGLPGLTLNMMWVGPIIAFAVLATGAWYALDTCKNAGWLSYYVVAEALTFAFMWRAPANDVVLVNATLANIWLVLAPIAGVAPLVVYAVRRRRNLRREQREFYRQQENSGANMAKQG
ncbi:Uncharacterised protein [Actinobaculum suis]|uniref:Uncharacterized protein n=1 Tax=Actinobaculum suis TaxID=1657 RepID=A0A7Z8Y8K2_9ACTO|nr:hypothetical protein [Actinobaculum suis]VDG75899.1 Uncharacterised protein [Actinobaculum suis]